MRNLFACLLHESQESVVDLVRNLAYLDPDSTILLYNGGSDPGLLERRFTVDGRKPLVHPEPRPQRWGRLHGFALDCMRYGLEELDFDALTVVDSDQLLVQPGYSGHIERFLATHPDAGMLGSVSGRQEPTTRIPPAACAWHESDRWLPFCRRFPGGEAAFPHWTFWPATVFTAAACGDLVRSFDEDAELAQLLASTRMFATEEVVLPTLVALHGRTVLESPCSRQFVRHRVLATPQQVRAGMAQPDVFWVHPVPRTYDAPLRRMIRAHHREYEQTAAPVVSVAQREPLPLLLTLPILERMRTVEGWLNDDEADLLIAGVARALAELPPPHAVVEIGSYCGRATTVLGAVVKAVRPDARVYAIDPHEGEIGALDEGIVRMSPSLARFRDNIASADLSDVTLPVQQRSYEVQWERPIAFLLVDALHDYTNVSRDFFHFEPWLMAGAYVAFHDYADYFPGVRTFVNELLASGRYERVHRAGSMMLLCRREDGGPAIARELAVRESAGRPGPSDASAPLVSCVMPTYARPDLVPRAVSHFLAQSYPRAELIVVDDGPESLADLLPDDPRVRHVRLEHRLTIGAKRNIGCEASRGELIANWDDDDWYAPWRLRYQVEALTARGADVAGLDHLLYFDPASGRAWRYVWPRNRRRWVHDAVLVFTRELWRRNPFPDTSNGIDCRFLWTRVPKDLLPLDDESFYVGIIHAGNTSPKHTRHGLWSAYPLAAIEELIGADADFYRRALASAPP